jgi:hypothetical protein
MILSASQTVSLFSNFYWQLFEETFKSTLFTMPVKAIKNALPTNIRGDYYTEKVDFY